MIRKYIQPDDHVLELGGCLGVVACLTDKLLGETSRHVVVEANPHLLPTLFRNHALNNCRYLIEFCLVAPGQSAAFRIDKSITGSGETQDRNAGIDVPCRSLEDLQSKHGSFTVLLMDIEGGEEALLAEYHDLLPGYRCLIIEFHEAILSPERIQASRGLLAQAGFSCVEKDGDTEVYLKSDLAASSHHNLTMPA